MLSYTYNPGFGHGFYSIFLPTTLISFQCTTRNFAFEFRQIASPKHFELYSDINKYEIIKLYAKCCIWEKKALSCCQWTCCSLFGQRFHSQLNLRRINKLINAGIFKWRHFRVQKVKFRECSWLRTDTGPDTQEEAVVAPMGGIAVTRQILTVTLHVGKSSLH